MVKYLLMLFVCVSVVAQEQTEEDNSKRPSWSSGLPERETPALNKPNFKNEMDNDLEIDMSGLEIDRDAISIEMPIPGVQRNESESTAEASVEVVEEAPAESAVDDTSEVVVDEVEAEPVVEAPAPEPEPQVEEPPVVEVETTNAVIEAEQIPAESPDQAAEAQADAGINENTVASLSAPAEPVNTDPVAEAAEAVSYQWKILQQAPVDYPMEARRNNQEGWVDVLVTINGDGNVVAVKSEKISRKGRVFRKAAMDSVQEWKFEPPKNQGVQGDVSRIYRIEFKL